MLQPRSDEIIQMQYAFDSNVEGSLDADTYISDGGIAAGFIPMYVTIYTRTGIELVGTDSIHVGYVDLDGANFSAWVEMEMEFLTIANQYASVFTSPGERINTAPSLIAFDILGDMQFATQFVATIVGYHTQDFNPNP